MDQGELLKLKIAGLKEKLEEATSPNLPTVLADIRQFIVKSPETVTCLTDEEIGVVVQGICRQKDMVIVTPTKNKDKVGVVTTATLKKLANAMSADDALGD